MSRDNFVGACASKSAYDDDTLFEKVMDQAALDSQRSICLVQISGVDQPCRVVHASPDGDCGFTSIRLALQLQGFQELSEEFSRENYIKLVMEQIKREDLDPIERRQIGSIFRIDGASRSEDWPARFATRWVEKEDFKFLSRHFNLKFFIYYELDGKFHPELSYEKIYTGDAAEADATPIALAHVSTELKDRPGASLNHFDAVIINPTPEQTSEIERINSNSPTSKKPQLVTEPSAANTANDKHPLSRSNSFQYNNLLDISTSMIQKANEASEGESGSDGGRNTRNHDPEPTPKILIENGKIVSVQWPDDDSPIAGLLWSGARSLKGNTHIPDIPDIPERIPEGLSVITGKNGSGKTFLIEKIKEELDDKEIPYIRVPYDYNPRFGSSSTFSDDHNKFIRSLANGQNDHSILDEISKYLESDELIPPAQRADSASAEAVAQPIKKDSTCSTS